MSVERPQTAPLVCTIAAGQSLVIDVSALRADAVVEVQRGVTVLGRRDAESANPSEISIAWDALRRQPAESSLVVFVSTPVVEHGRTLAVAPLPERYLQMDLRLHDPRPLDWLCAVAPAIVGAATAVEAARASSYSSAERTVFSLGCAMVAIALLARWSVAVLRREVVRRGWRALGVAALALAAAPHGVGAREVRIGAEWPLSVTDRLVLFPSAPGTSALIEEERSLIALRPARWSERFLRWNIVRARPSRFVRVPADTVNVLQIQRYSRCGADRSCVFDALTAAEGRSITLAAPGERFEGGSIHERGSPVRLSDVALDNLETVRDAMSQWEPYAIETSFAPRASIRWVVPNGLTISVDLHDSRATAESARTHVVLLPQESELQFDALNGVRASNNRAMHEFIVAGVGPSIATLGQRFEADPAARSVVAYSTNDDFEHASGAFTGMTLPLGDDSSATPSVVEVPTNSRRLFIVSAELESFRALRGVTGCPEVNPDDEQREMRVLIRVFGVPSERGWSIAPIEASKRVIGTWSPVDHRDAHRYVVVCQVFRGEALPRASGAFERVDATRLSWTPVAIAVGSLASDAPARAATLAPRYRGGVFEGYDLRMD